MSHLRFAWIALWLLAASTSLASAAGRHYCSNVRGEVVVSDTPCQSSDTSTTESAKRTLPDLPRADGAPFADPSQLRDQHVKYMSSRCRYLYETMMSLRVSQWASVTWQQKQNADNNYRAECGEEEQDARSRQYRDTKDGRRARTEETRQQRETELQRTQNEAQTREQCAESRRIIASRRARSNMTPGELQDLVRFEENVKQRCQPSGAAPWPS